MRKTIFSLIICILLPNMAFVQDILQLKDHPPQKANLSDLSWMSGYWKGSGLGGVCEELWMPTTDSSMNGVFRFLEQNTLQFTEYMAMVQNSDGSIEIQLKHFSKELSPWEEKEQWINFKLIKIQGKIAYFDGLTYQRLGKRLLIKLELTNKEKRWIEIFKLKKTRL